MIRSVLVKSWVIILVESYPIVLLESCYSVLVECPAGDILIPNIALSERQMLNRVKFWNFFGEMLAQFKINVYLCSVKLNKLIMERKEIKRLVRQEALRIGCNNYKKQLTTVINSPNVQRAITILEQKEKILPTIKAKLNYIIRDVRRDFYNGSFGRPKTYDCDLNVLTDNMKVCFAKEEATQERFNYVIISTDGPQVIIRKLNSVTPIGRRICVDSMELKDINYARYKVAAYYIETEAEQIQQQEFGDFLKKLCSKY